MTMQKLDSMIDSFRSKHPEMANSFDSMTKEERDRLRVQNNVDAFNQQEGDRHLQDGYECTACKNKGYISIVRSRQDFRGTTVHEELLMPCKCESVRRSIAKMKRSGLENLFKKYTFKNYETNEPWQEAIKQQAMTFAENPAALFFIGGQSGAGKTHLCTSIARQLLYNQGKELLYVLWRDESVKLKAIINKDEEYQSRIEELKRVDMLYIDDFLKVPIGQDAGKPTSADLSLALEIINNRYNNNLITIISSEWTILEIIEFDEALGGRIYELTGKDNCINIKKDMKKNHRIRDIVEF